MAINFRNFHKVKLWKFSHFYFMISVSLSVRNLLVMSSVFSLFGGVALLITNVLLLDGLRKEQETAFKGWLYSMGFFAPWKWLAWAFAGIVNDMIFAYNIIMLIAWFFFNILNVFSFLCIYSLYLELSDLTKLQDLARLKVCFLFCILITQLKKIEIESSTQYSCCPV